jgi:hypothetical protein
VVVYLSRKAIQTFLTLIVLFSIFVVTLTPTPVKAGTFDGTYDYKYTVRGPSGWETYTLHSGFIVSNGRISSNPSALSGTVDSSGNAYFTGPSPYGQGHGTAVYTGVIKSDGTGSGNYQDSTGLGGSWSVTRVSGGGGAFDLAQIILTIMSIFSPIGELFGLSGGTAAAVGVAAVVVPIVVIASIASTRSAMKKQKAEARKAMERQKTEASPKMGVIRPRTYEASQPAPPPASTPQEIPPPIDSSQAKPIGGVGVGQGPPPLPSSLNLRATWPRGEVNLDWDQPQFDPNKYELQEYIVSRMEYGSTSTAPQKVPLERVPPQQTNWNGDFTQNYRWNTSGDVDRYIVDAVLRNISDSSLTYIPDAVYVP